MKTSLPSLFAAAQAASNAMLRKGTAVFSSAARNGATNTSSNANRGSDFLRCITRKPVGRPPGKLRQIPAGGDSIRAADMRCDFARIEIGELRMQRGAERRERRGAGVGARLLGIFRAGDEHTHGLEVEAPAQREVGERRAGRHERLQRIGEFDAFLK